MGFGGRHQDITNKHADYRAFSGRKTHLAGRWIAENTKPYPKKKGQEAVP